MTTTRSTRRQHVAMVITLLAGLAGSSVALGGEAQAASRFVDTNCTIYEQAVDWMVASGITTGTSANFFTPDAGLIRGQVALFLHRQAGQPAAGGDGFTDTNGTRYDQAVKWMVANGIASGVTPTTFRPDALVTRGHVALFLWRKAGQPAAGGNGFADTNGTPYDRAVKWLVASGIATGTSANTFSPQAPLTRGQMALFLWRQAGSPGAAPTTGIRRDPCAEQEIFNHHNQARAASGVGALTRNGCVDGVAAAWAEHMVRTGTQAHNPRYQAQVQACFAQPVASGENIIWGFPTVAEAIAWWMNSAPHRSNIQNGAYTQIGIGTFRAADGGVWAVVNFVRA